MLENLILYYDCITRKKLLLLKKNIILLPSCVSPIVKKNISNLIIPDNIKDLNLNLKNLYKKTPDISNQYLIVISDCSQDYQLSFDDINIDSNISNLKIVNINFSNDEINLIESKGKGYSEVLMIKKTLDQLGCSGNEIIYKLTARYSLKFPDSLLRYHSNLMKKNDFAILYSNIFKRTSCHFFSIKYSFIREIVDEILCKLNDYNGNILEKVLFDYIKDNDLIRKKRVGRSRIFSYYIRNLQPGSTLARNNSSSYFYQFLRNICFLL